MAVRCTFEQWQKDVFFSAAEEVQESADIMESIYRMWIRGRKDECMPDVSDELRQELHTTIGTAKWQLEEFEKAVKLSYGSYPSEESTITRHRQFINVMKGKISDVEKTLKDSLIDEGKQPLWWVQLDEEERDDLALFLSRTPQPLEEMTKDRNAGDRLDQVHIRAAQGSVKDTETVSKDAISVDKVPIEETMRNKDKVPAQGKHLHGKRRTWSSPDIGDWKIAIAEENADRGAEEVKAETTKRPSSICGFLKSVESTAVLNWSGNRFPKAKSEERRQLRQGLSTYLNLMGVSWFAQGINKFNDRSRNCLTSCREDFSLSDVQKLFGHIGGLQRHFQGSQYVMQDGRSLRVMLFLVLTIFLVAGQIAYSVGLLAI